LVCAPAQTARHGALRCGPSVLLNPVRRSAAASLATSVGASADNGSSMTCLRQSLSS
jgi:hypothetical protein